MGSPTIFKGKFTKLLSERGILNKDGSLNEKDGYLNLIKNPDFETGLSGVQLATFDHTTYTGLPTLGAPDIEMVLDTTTPLFGTSSLIVKTKSTSPVWPAGQGIIFQLGDIPFGLKNGNQYAGFSWQLPNYLTEYINADWTNNLGTFRYCQ